MPHKDTEARRAYRKKRRALDRERDRTRYETDTAFRARKIASAKKYYQEHKAKRNAQKERWRAAHPELQREYARKCMANFRMRFYFDAEAYAAYRAYNRKFHAKEAVLKRGSYRPHFWFRIPDWMTKGMATIDSRSPFLFENITPSQRAYARELAIERKEARSE